MGDPGVRIIAVVGMHRSGTSVVTRGLQVMGVELGSRLMPPFAGNNSKGFWEDIDINTLNIEMLHSLKSDWHFLAPIQPEEVDTLCRNGYLQRALELLQVKTTGVQLFGFKDPRVAKMLPFWKKVFAQAQAKIDYVVVIRHPLSVCQSLAKRDGFDFEKSYLLWLDHVIGSLVGTEGEDRVLVDYDLLIQEPDSEITRIAKGLKLSINTADLEKFKTEFLDRELRHTTYQLHELTLDNAAPPLVREIYSSLLELAAHNSSLQEVTLKNKTGQWNKEFIRMRSMLVLADKLGSRITTISAERNALSSERDALLAENARVLQALREKEQVAQKLTNETLAIYRSRSWRWTAPLRRLLTFFR